MAAEQKTEIDAVEARVKRDEVARVSIAAQIRDLKHLDTLLRKLGMIKDVRHVQRLTRRRSTS